MGRRGDSVPRISAPDKQRSAGSDQSAALDHWLPSSCNIGIGNFPPPAALILDQLALNIPTEWTDEKHSKVPQFLKVSISMHSGLIGNSKLTSIVSGNVFSSYSSNLG